MSKIENMVVHISAQNVAIHNPSFTDFAAVTVVVVEYFSLGDSLSIAHWQRTWLQLQKHQMSSYHLLCNTT